MLLSDKKEDQITRMLGIPMGLVKEVTVSELSLHRLHAIPGLQPKQCYQNVVYAGLALDAKAVVFGLVEVHGVLIEHAWLEKEDGAFIDPTLQMISDPDDVHTYYAAVAIEMDEYAALMKKMPEQSKAIDFMDLRRAGVFSVMSEILKNNAVDGLVYLMLVGGVPGFSVRELKSASKVEDPSP